MLGRTLRSINVNSTNNVNQTGNNYNHQADLKSRLLALSTAQLKVSDENDVPAALVSRFTSKIPVLKPQLFRAATTSVTNVRREAQPPPPVITTSSTSNEEEKPSNVHDIDGDKNCFLLSDYAPEIYKYLRQLEVKQGLEANFLTRKSMAPSHRALLINWLVEVHRSFTLCSETLYICVSIADRYFAREQVAKAHIQLVGITALFIASKFEEIYYPEVNEFVSVCDNLYTKRDILRMELRILDVLKFQLGCPVALHFLRRGSKAAQADGRTHMLAKYLCELMLLEYESAHWKPSLMAATALYVSLKLKIDREPCEEVWTLTTEYYTGYSEAELLAKTVPVMVKAILSSENSKHQNVRKKYQSAKFMSISKLTPSQTEIVRNMARPRSTSTLGLTNYRS